MDKILNHPKSTLLGVLIAIALGVLGAIHHGQFDLSQPPDAATAIPMLATLALGALSTDNSALVKLFFDDWRTTAIGIGSAVATAVLTKVATGAISNKAILMAGIAAVFGWVSTHKPESTPSPPSKPPGDPPTTNY